MGDVNARAQLAYGRQWRWGENFDGREHEYTQWPSALIPPKFYRSRTSGKLGQCGVQPFIGSGRDWRDTKLALKADHILHISVSVILHLFLPTIGVAEPIWEHTVALPSHHSILPIGNIRNCWGYSVSLTFMSQGVVPVAETAPLHNAVEMESRDNKSHWAAQLVLWSACRYYERNHYKARLQNVF